MLARVEFVGAGADPLPVAPDGVDGNGEGACGGAEGGPFHEAEAADLLADARPAFAAADDVGEFGREDAGDEAADLGADDARFCLADAGDGGGGLAGLVDGFEECAVGGVQVLGHGEDGVDLRLPAVAAHVEGLGQLPGLWMFGRDDFCGERHLSPLFCVWCLALSFAGCWFGWAARRVFAPGKGGLTFTIL